MFDANPLCSNDFTLILKTTRRLLLLQGVKS